MLPLEAGGKVRTHRRSAVIFLPKRVLCRRIHRLPCTALHRISQSGLLHPKYSPSLWVIRVWIFFVPDISASAGLAWEH
jgi:hypothetical protein